MYQHNINYISLFFLFLSLSSLSYGAHPVTSKNIIAAKLQEDILEGDNNGIDKNINVNRIGKEIERAIERMGEAVNYLQRMWDEDTYTNVNSNENVKYGTIQKQQIEAELQQQRELHQKSELHQTTENEREAKSTRATTCVPPGVPGYRVVHTNTCTGKHCFLKQVVCNGTTIDLTSKEWNQTIVKNCLATKLDCFGEYPSYATYDLKEQYGATNCSIDPQPLTTGDSYVQVWCNDNLNFGYQSFGFPCATDAFLCGNLTLRTKLQMDLHKNEILSGNCQKIQAPCFYTESLRVNYTCNAAHDSCKYTTQDIFIACGRMLNSTVCICPVDLTGTRCSMPVNFTCSLSLSYPSPNCLPTTLKDPKDTQLDGDRKCTVYGDFNGPVEMGYRLSCVPSISPNLSYVSGINFSYWINTPTLNITSPPKWTIRDKKFNFNSLSDSGAVLLGDSLSREQILGNELVWFNFSLSDIPERFWIARRLYHEVGINFGNDLYNSGYRGYIDTPTRPISTARYSKTSTTKIVFIVAIVLSVVGVIGYLAFKIYRKTKLTAKKSK